MSPAAQPRMTHACSSPGWMVQNLINYSSSGGTARLNPGQSGATGRPTPRSLPSPWALKLMLPPAQECQIAYLSTLSNPVEPLSTLSNPVEPTCHPKPSKQ